ncbi:hypothetical protein QAD02_018854 [Eretmocerus hayati]|uniref:Uncharacterized protein n=1 Tax=Eretmocerus hayati TaxID=131215 RepID=A0ACC2PI72_9HYME|nr:hypothetical protein QAD02_018854 [Eretmocerus hayati]
MRPLDSTQETPAPKRLRAGQGRAGARKRIKHKDSLNNITTGDIKRLARRGGVKRISALIYPLIRTALKEFLIMVVFAASIYTRHAKRNTVTAQDVIHALKRHGCTLYGFDKIK